MGKSERSELRAYLLGLVPSGKIEDIEKKLFLDREYFAGLLTEEEGLIEDYIDNQLLPEEREAFEKNFLTSKERLEQTDLTDLLRTYVLEQAPAAQISQDVGKGKWWNPGIKSWPSRSIAAGLLVILGFSIYYLVEKYSSSDSAEQQALSSLNNAYKKERPFESRISDLDYAPFIKLRDSTENPVLSIEIEKARSIAVTEVARNPTSESRHLLARVYLSIGEFDKALQLLKEAHEADPQNAKILSDTGFLYLEKSRSAKEDSDKLTFVADAVDYFDRALAVDPGLLPARFNKAIATEIYLPNRAKELWQDYLQRDPESGWAVEAKTHLNALSKSGAKIYSTPDELESAFAAAYRKGDYERAMDIVSQNRELIHENYLPQKLAADFVKKKRKDPKSWNS